MGLLEDYHYAINHSTALKAMTFFVFVSIVTLLKTQLTLSCLLCLSLASNYSVISSCSSVGNFICLNLTVSGDCTSVICFGFVHFHVPRLRCQLLQVAWRCLVTAGAQAR